MYVESGGSPRAKINSAARELSECRLQRSAGNRRDGGEQAIREFTPEGSTDLCDLLNGGEPIETRDQ